MSENREGKSVANGLSALGAEGWEVVAAYVQELQNTPGAAIAPLPPAPIEYVLKREVFPS